MSTVVNNPPNSDSGGNGMGFLLGVILLVVAVFLLFTYGLPILQRSGGNANPQLNVPGQVDVNIQKSK
ncbi:MAG: hypothetical protein UR15_C0025G0013 [Parcubacteria group bacterium GW2011_GWA2_31_28]|nr:MAG: hypothetical protein UR15_C0025G0013 [Parcubacteria group bacterium GW2011_GWA2_31_28]